MRKLRSRARPWLKENPQADFAELEKTFGTPECIAAAYLDEMPQEEILTRLSDKRKIVAAVAIAAMLAVAVWAIILTTTAIELRNDKNSGVTYVYLTQQEDMEASIP